MRFRQAGGSGSLLGLAVVGAIILLFSLLVPLLVGLGIRQTVGIAADAAALAAADVAAGIYPGVPCGAARLVAAANHAAISQCSVDGLIATVGVHSDFLGISLRASATAGPPGAVSN